MNELMPFENKVVIALEYYEKLIAIDEKSKMMIEAFKSAASLSYNDKHMIFDDTTLDVAFNLLYPNTYSEIMMELHEKKAADEQMNKGE